MRNKVMILCLVVIIVFFNISIYQKEQIKKQGTVVLLALAPVDPRSLIQGDYMHLRYVVARDAEAAIYADVLQRIRDNQFTTKISYHGYLVAQLGADHVAHFIRFDEGTLLKKDQIRLPYTYKHAMITVNPDSFLFQEGDNAVYTKAKYGLFKLLEPDQILLIGLADEHKKLINPRHKL